MTRKDKFVEIRTSISTDLKEQDSYWNKPQILGHDSFVEVKPFYCLKDFIAKHSRQSVGINEPHADAYISNMGSAGYVERSWECPKNNLNIGVLRPKYGEYPVYKNMALPD